MNFLRRVTQPKIAQENYTNVDDFIGTIVSSRLATLHELQTVYSLESAFDLWEIIVTDNYNNYLVNKYIADENSKNRRGR